MELAIFGNTMKDIPIARLPSQKEPSLLGNFTIRDIEKLLAETDMVQELHRHDFYFLLVLRKGIGEHIIDFKPYEVSDGSIFFMRPGQVHQLTLKTGSRGFVVQFTPDFYMPKDQKSLMLLNRASSKNHCVINPLDFEPMNTVLSQIFQEYTGKKEGFEKVITAYMDIFFVNLLRHQKSASLIPNRHEQEGLESFLHLLETHFSTHKKVSDYANMLNLSLYQLNAITKSGMGKTCSEIIIDRIVLEAKRYLLATSNQIKEIAFQLGYDDVSYFVRFFKRQTGHSPESFRQLFT